MPIIRAETLPGVPLNLEIDPTLTGTWKLTARDGRRPLATKPQAKFAFGVKLYTAHECARMWSKK
jgi:hypothetical protein